MGSGVFTTMKTHRREITQAEREAERERLRQLEALICVSSELASADATQSSRIFGALADVTRGRRQVVSAVRGETLQLLCNAM